MIDFLANDVLPVSDKRARKVFLTSDSFYLGQDGLIYRLDRNQKRSVRDSFSQLAVPQSIKYEILSNVHDHVASAHFGIHKTFHKLKQRYWWQGKFCELPPPLTASTSPVRHHEICEHCSKPVRKILVKRQPKEVLKRCNVLRQRALKRNCRRT